MTRLRQVSCHQPGWRRRRAGRGFAYLDQDGRRLGEAERERIRALAIPPAWTDVWICPRPNGHLQAVGTDAAGRRQYLYHPAWRTARDEEKFLRARALGEALPKVRSQARADLASDTTDRRWACALATLLLDEGCFRVGSQVYADDNGSYGLTTLRREDVRCRADGAYFSYVGKSGVAQSLSVIDPDCVAALRLLARRRSGPDSLLVHRTPAGWRPVDAATVNDYLRELSGEEISAKDFRTWHGTVVAARALALGPGPGGSAGARRAAITAAVAEVAERLGNTPTIARGSYIDPLVISAFEDGRVVQCPDLAHAAPEEVERACLDLLDDLTG